MPGGSFVGALISGFLTDWLGRKRAIQIGAVIWIIGSVIVCSSQNIGQLVVGRFINGLSVGIESAQVPVYVAELAHPSKRGRVVGAQQWASTSNSLSYLDMITIRHGVNLPQASASITKILHPPPIPPIPSLWKIC